MQVIAVPLGCGSNDFIELVEVRCLFHDKDGKVFLRKIPATLEATELPQAAKGSRNEQLDNDRDD